MTTEDYIKLIAGLGGLVTFIFAIWQYQQSERWKRVQFVGQEIRAMKANLAAPEDAAARERGERRTGGRVSCIQRGTSARAPILTFPLCRRN